MTLPINQIIQGDCIKLMKGWPDGTVDCCITSPPYWGLRDYGVDNQIGLEKTPEEYVAKMVKVFAEVHRLLKPQGTLWLNLGDSYNSTGTKCSRHWDGRNKNITNQDNLSVKGKIVGLKEKDLCGIPWRVAFALQQFGWHLRQDIIWHKPNPMPESVTDRCTKAHEYIFLLTKNARYYFDNEAIKEEAVVGYKGTDFLPNSKKDKESNEIGSSATKASKNNRSSEVVGIRNKRSVWTVPTSPYKEAHFATFPLDLIKPCILAGTSEKGCCSKCGKAWVRQVESKRLSRPELPKDDPRYRPNTYNGAYQDINGKGDSGYVETKTIGWQPQCDCNADIVPAVILDPFMGSGTTAVVAYNHNRDYVGCELNPTYCKLGRIEEAQDQFSLLELNK
jgi:DNA modification methylase